MVTSKTSLKAVPVPTAKPVEEKPKSISFSLESVIAFIIQLGVSLSLKKRQELLNDIVENSLRSEGPHIPYPQYYKAERKICAVTLSEERYQAVVAEAKRQSVNPSEFLEREITKAQHPKVVEAMNHLLKVMEQVSAKSADKTAHPMTDLSPEHASWQENAKTRATSQLPATNGTGNAMTNHVAPKSVHPTLQPSNLQANSIGNQTTILGTSPSRSESPLSTRFETTQTDVGFFESSNSPEAPTNPPHSSKPYQDRVDADFAQLLGEAPPVREEPPF